MGRGPPIWSVVELLSLNQSQCVEKGSKTIVEFPRISLAAASCNASVVGMAVCGNDIDFE